MSTDKEFTNGCDEFIQTHLQNIMDKTADIFIDMEIGGMFGSLETASVEYFLKTGKINGAFRDRLKKMMVNFAKNWHTTASKSKP